MQAFITMLSSLLKKSAEVTYVENYLSRNAYGEGNQLNIISEVIAGANSNITYGSVDYIRDKGFTGHMIRHLVLLKRMPQLIGH